MDTSLRLWCLPLLINQVLCVCLCSLANTVQSKHTQFVIVNANDAMVAVLDRSTVKPCDKNEASFEVMLELRAIQFNLRAGTWPFSCLQNHKITQQKEAIFNNTHHSPIIHSHPVEHNGWTCCHDTYFQRFHAQFASGRHRQPTHTLPRNIWAFSQRTTWNLVICSPHTTSNTQQADQLLWAIIGASYY